MENILRNILSNEYIQCINMDNENKNSEDKKKFLK